jgi:purine nucleosidase
MAEQPDATARRKVVLDTDPGIDDAMALLFLAASPRLELTAITTVFGNSDVETTTRNALRLVQHFDIPAPVHRGAAAPLLRPRGPGAHHVHGRNGMGDVDLGTQPIMPADGPAAETLVELIHAHPHELTLLAIAPLTNLAAALSIDPAIAPLVQEVIIMGGAFGFHGRGGNVSPFAEANIHNDPEAAAAVLDAAWPVTMVGLDVTTRCVLTPAHAAQLAREAGAPGRFIAEIAKPYAAAYREFDGIDGCCIHDVAAVAMAIDPSLFRLRRGRIRVATEGIAVGQTTQTPRPPRGRPVQQICTHVDEERLLMLFVETLMSPAAPD